jgi:hypothetical protein
VARQTDRQDRTQQTDRQTGPGRQADRIEPGMAWQSCPPPSPGWHGVLRGCKVLTRFCQRPLGDPDMPRTSSSRFRWSGLAACAAAAYVCRVCALCGLGSFYFFWGGGGGLAPSARGYLSAFPSVRPPAHPSIRLSVCLSCVWTTHVRPGRVRPQHAQGLTRIEPSVCFGGDEQFFWSRGLLCPDSLPARSERLDAVGTCRPQPRAPGQPVSYRRALR